MMQNVVVLFWFFFDWNNGRASVATLWTNKLLHKQQQKKGVFASAGRIRAYADG